MKKSAYIETTIVSYLTGWPSRDLIRAARQEITHRWWRERRRQFDLFVSQVVFDEAEKGDKRAAARRKRVLDRLTRLDTTDEARELAAALVEEGALPPKVVGDAMHLAIATVKRIDFLLTWNYRHLANPELRGLIGKVVAARGYQLPIVCTPEELMGDVSCEKTP